MFDTIIAEMKNVRMLRKRRAVSPVIATVILVAVTITVAVAVAYWMSSIAGQYTGFEKVEIQSGYASIIVDADEVTEVLGDNPATPDPEIETDWVITPYSAATSAGWKIVIKLKNTGSAPSTITDCFVNEKPLEEYLDAIKWYYLDETETPVLMTEEVGVTLESGVSVTLNVNIIQSGVTFTAGTTVNVKLHSAGGMDYIRLVQLS